MPYILPFNSPRTPSSATFSSPQAEGVATSIRTLFEKLPHADQQLVIQALKGGPELIPASRAGGVLKVVAHLLPQKREWTATEIKTEIAKAGVEATQREVFNAIGYLVRKNRVQRLGAGRYLVDGAFVVETSDELGVEPPRDNDE